jgi:superoxide reductase
MEMKFYICRHCGNIIAKVKDSGVPVMCCGEAMAELIPGTSDGAAEKHVPVWKAEGNKVIVSVGAVPHPMTEAHHIEWIAIQTKFGNQRKALQPGGKPEVCFAVCEGDEVQAVYAFCNIHGLWKA